MAQFTLHLEPLANYGNSLLEQPGRLVALNVSSLAGGYTSTDIYRVDLDFSLETGEARRIPVVWKQTTENEVRVMRVLADVSGAQALPQLIDRGQNQPVAGQESAHWFVMPFYAGKFISTTHDEVPTTVIDSLARLHAYFAPRLDQLDWMPHFDSHAFRGMLAWVMGRLAEAEARHADGRLADIRRAIRSVSESPLIESAFERLPATFIHGDVHGGNIVQLADGGAVLIDWGNARLAPAMFDLANMVDIDSENWQYYLTTWEKATGQALEPSLARLGYRLATVMVNSQYLPFAVRDWPNNTEAPGQALEMIERLENAVQAMAGDM